MFLLPIRRTLAAVVLVAVLGFARASPALDLTTATIKELNAALDAGTVTSEQLVRLYLARIAAYDRAGPQLNAVMVINPKALETAAALDAERKAGKRRSALHGIPIVVKDNIDTADLPTTAGSFMLKDSLPPDDAFVVQRLRQAGAIILAKTNMSEFASGPALSSLGGRIRNPYNAARSPGGSSGGSGVALAAAFAAAGLGTDTGGSVRVPAAANGIVGLKTTMGLISRDGVVPLALSFDTVGPMGRNVTDVAMLLGALAGVDPADPVTHTGEGKNAKDYAMSLDADALKGARVGIARDFMGQNGDVDWVTEASLAAMRRAGANVIDVSFPKWLRETGVEWFTTVMNSEFRAQIQGYLATLDRRYPKTFDDLMGGAMALTAPDADGAIPNPGRWAEFVRPGAPAPAPEDQVDAIRRLGLPHMRAVIEGVMHAERLDAIVYPTRARPFDLVDATPDPLTGYRGPSFLVNLAGFAELVVPAGFTSHGMPVTMSFLGGAFSEPKLLALGYAFEQRMNAYRLPASTPPLPGEAIAP
ncbi:MAG: amidase family protein [Rhodospirillaceae bacterium]|nr:amidase family protein [Rhodospirillaceae bacterium]